MWLDQHKKFLGYDLGVKLLTAAEADPVLPPDSQVLNPKSDISGCREVKFAAKVVKVKKAALSAIKKASVWEVLPGLIATQALPSHILDFVLTMLKKYFWHEMYRHLSLTAWSLMLRNRSC